ncbi:helix-turn-helix transcriptional regulator [Bacillus sp. JJ722]|uniref:helix-turn-helix transcriptional regulator n=1 Tax=Bacillus sp. JJ722 TaxID=3122973 RepID=UPI002FFED442
MNFFRPIQPPILEADPLDSTYRYREYLPSESLASYVACYWTVDYCGLNTNKLHRIVPDGCVDIIVDLHASSPTKGAFIAGLMTQYKVLNLSEKCSSFGIRFYLDTVDYFLNHSVSEFIGNQVFLEDIWGVDGDYFVKEIISATDITEMIVKVESKLLNVLQKNTLKRNCLIQASMHYMFDSKGIISIRSLSEKLCYSERHIRRSFQSELGVSPKEIINIIRFQNILHELKIDSRPCFTEIAMKYGYYDQSHFCKNFKGLYGVSPSGIGLKK